MGVADKEWRIVFLGPPNSGKGTQAAVLSRRLAVPAISTGEMLRAAVAAGTSLGQKVEGVMRAGHLVSDELMAEVVRERLAQADSAGGFILDGYPRTASQAETLDGILADRGHRLDGVVFVDAPEAMLIARGLARGRKDDTEEILRERLRVYRDETSSLVDRYATLGVLSSIDGSQSIDQVSAAIFTALGVDGPGAGA